MKAASPEVESGREQSWVAEAAEHLRQTTGIAVPVYRWPVLETVVRRILGDKRPAALNAWLASNPAAWRELMHAVVIPETYFFRHMGHFRVLAKLARERLLADRPCRVLSAGCATGEEAWSAAAAVAGVYLPKHANFNVEAWDLDPLLARRARTGEYRDWSVRNGFYGYESFFTRRGQHWLVSPKLRPFVRFREVNLVNDALPPLTFDAIFFRNVAIYWESATVRQVLGKLGERLEHDGVLMLGPSDPTELDRKSWEAVPTEGTLIYRRPTPSGRTKKRPTRRGRNETRPAKTLSPGPLSDTLLLLRSSRSLPEDATRLASTLSNGVPAVRAAPAKPSPDPPMQRTPRAKLSVNGTWLDRARTLADAGRYDDALALIEGRGDNALDPSARVLAGILLLNLERPRDAMQRFRQAVFLEPEEPAHRRWLAVALEELGRAPEAAREIRNAEELEHA
jgi:chemotaxis protein methyltransferase WspC